MSRATDRGHAVHRAFAQHVNCRGTLVPASEMGTHVTRMVRVERPLWFRLRGAATALFALALMAKMYWFGGPAFGHEAWALPVVLVLGSLLTVWGVWQAVKPGPQVARADFTSYLADVLTQRYARELTDDDLRHYLAVLEGLRVMGAMADMVYEDQERAGTLAEEASAEVERRPSTKDRGGLRCR